MSTYLKMQHTGKFLFLFLFGISITKGYAQLQTLSSHYHLNQLSYNPASAGSDGGVNIFLNYRGQWVGITGSPHTQTLAADLSLPMINSGVGIVVTNDIIGAERHTSVRGNFAYFLDVSKNYKIGFGAAAGMINTSIDGSKLTTPEGEDDFLPDAKVGFIRPDIALGVNVQSKQLKAGISYNSLLKKGSIEGVSNTLETKYGSYLNLFAAYKINIKNKFGLEPSVLMRTDFNQWQTDLGVLFDYKNYIFTGVYFRGYNKASIDALYATVGFKPIGSLSIFYSYDVGMSALNKVHNGSHELSVKVSIPEEKLYKQGKMIYNPRYL
jgi:type IX secretion system PorP/SprF family membrane protein